MTILARQLYSDLAATVAVSDADLAPGDPVTWTLAVTGGSQNSIAKMGALMCALGLLLVAARRRPARPRG